MNVVGIFLKNNGWKIASIGLTVATAIVKGRVESMEKMKFKEDIIKECMERCTKKD